MTYIEVEPGVKVFVKDWGSGKPIVFIHGWPVNHKMWEYQFNQLPQHGYRCIGIDLRGFGQSDQPWGDYNYDIFADDVSKILDALTLSEVTLVGHSMGGAIALHYMARHRGKQVAKVALIGAAAPSMCKRPDFPQGANERAGFDGLIKACYTDRPQALMNFGNEFFRDPVSPKFADWFHSLGMEASPRATVMGVIELRDRDLRPELATITVPTSIFHGVDDKVAPFALAEVMNQGIKGSKLIRFESGHGLFYEEMDKFNTELIQFAS